MAPSALSSSPPPRYHSPEHAVKATDAKSASMTQHAVAAQQKPKAAKALPKDFNPYHNVMGTEETEADRIYPYPHLKPAFPTDIVTAPYEPIHDFIDRGTFADPEKKRLFAACSKVDQMTVNIGTEITGPQLSDLSPEALDDLALLVAERGLVVIRNQDLTPEQLVEFGSYFGAKERPLHQHPSSGVPRQRGLDNIHVVWHDESMLPQRTDYSHVDLWHTDVPFELNPPGLTALYNITNPVHGGGDTLFSSCYGLYDALSEPMQQYLESLSALQSGLEQAEGAKRAGVHLRRPPIETVHPLVRTHPVTGWKSIFASPAFTKRIVGVPMVESDHILKMLYDIMGADSNLNVRVRWEKGTIAIWDNRVVNHQASFDFYRPSPDCRRHALRVASTAEIPSLTLPNGQPGRSRKECIWEEMGLDVEALKLRERTAHGRKGGFKD